jgi:DNA-directed RNA polymerase subunit N (RpoN/RPB10)
MLIPVRCATCGNIIGSKYKKYKKMVEEYKRNFTKQLDITVNKYMSEHKDDIQEIGQLALNYFTTYEFADTQVKVTPFNISLLSHKHYLKCYIIQNILKINPNIESQVLTFDKPNENIYGKLMEQVGAIRYCCKRHFLGQQEIMYKL